MTFFNQEATNYDSWYQTKLGSFVDEVETDCALSLFKPQNNQNILDAGCGTGNFSIKLAQKGATVTGIDVSEEMLKIAAEKTNTLNLPLAFKEMDLYNLEFPDNHFDAVFSMAAFEFIKEPIKAFKELFRVLKPKGQLLIGTINLVSPWGKLYTSKEFQENTVFKYADFKTLEEMSSYYPAKLKSKKECLFIPPDIKEENIDYEHENYYKDKNRGGFICLLWEK